MPTLSRAALSEYDSALSRLESGASDYVRRQLEAYMAANPAASVAECRDFAIQSVNDAVGIYGDGASALAADLYDELAARAGRSLPAAAPETADVTPFVDKEVRYQAGKLADGAPTEFVRQVSRCASDQVSRRANATMMRNVGRDHVRYARVPLGVETCDFCVMLASRGFVYHTARTAGEGDHWHRSCRCKVIPGMSGDFAVEGYSGEQYEALARADAEIDADGSLTPEQRDAAKRALQEYDAARYYGEYGESGVAGRVRASGTRRRARRNDVLFASAEGDYGRLARYVADARSESDLMYRAARAVGDMAHRRDWASVAALRDVAKATGRSLEVGPEPGRVVPDTAPGVPHVRAKARTGGMSSDDYAAYRRELSQLGSYKTIRLGRAEYARVISEINTHMSDEDRVHAIVSKPIGNYRYTFVNRGFDDYEFIRKTKLR